MSEPKDLDPIGVLRAVNPTPADDVPDASLARVSARVQEHIVSHDQKSTIPSNGRGLRLALLGGAALTGVLVIALAAGALGGQRPGSPASPTDAPIVAVNPTSAPVAANPTSAPVAVAPTKAPVAAPTDTPVDPGGGMAMCIMYDPATLPTFDQVFDGTVTAVDGDQVTFSVNEGWKNASGSVTLTVPDTSAALLGPMPDFEVGGRYLVSATDGTVTNCGYTLDYDADEAADWAAAFAN